TAPSSGASGIFSDTGNRITTAITNASGIATSSAFTANNTAGSYNVSATVASLTTQFPFLSLSAWPTYFDLQLNESRGWVYGSDSTGKRIDVISTTSLKLVKSFTLTAGAAPKNIALSPDGSELVITEFGAGKIRFLNPDTGATIATLTPNATSPKPWDVIY